MKGDKRSNDESVSCQYGKRLGLLVVLLLWIVESLKVRLVGKMGLNILELGRSAGQISKANQACHSPPPLHHS